jgi:NurA-like 5'-3' nuclease
MFTNTCLKLKQNIVSSRAHALEEWYVTQLEKLDSNSCFKRNNEYSKSTRKLDANKSKKVLKALRTQFETHERTQRDEHKQFKELEHATRRLIIE